MKRNNNDLLKEKLNEMWKLLQPKDSEPCKVFQIGNMLICKSLLSDRQLREGQEIHDDCMSPVSGKFEDVCDAILCRLKYHLWEFDIMKKEKQQLHRDIYKYRKLFGDGEDCKDGPAPPDSDKD